MEWLLPIIICVLAGVILLIVEIFMPGFGIPGISGIVLLLVGIVMTWIEFGAKVGLGMTVAVLALVGIMISISIKSVSSGKLNDSPLVLKNETADEKNDEEMNLLVGKTGETRTALRPVGTAEFDCGRLNVNSEDGYVEAGVRVRIVRVEGTTIFVTRA